MLLFAIGLFLGAILGFFVVGLCHIAARRQRELMTPPDSAHNCLGLCTNPIDGNLGEVG